MDNLPFVIWVLLWPVCCALCSLIYAKRRKSTGESQLTSSDYALQALVEVIIWYAVGSKL